VTEDMPATSGQEDPRVLNDWAQSRSWVWGLVDRRPRTGRFFRFCIHVSPVPLLQGHGRVGVIRIRIDPSGVGHGLYKKTAGPGNGNGSLQTESNSPVGVFFG